MVGSSKISIPDVPVRRGSGYPEPYCRIASQREKRALGDAGGLSDFGVNLVRLPPGAWSSQRHWHAAEDEFVFLLEGELTLVTDAGEISLRSGECAAFPKGHPDAHHMINRSGETAIYLEIGTRMADDVCTYPDIDLRLDASGFSHKDGTPYDR